MLIYPAKISRGVKAEAGVVSPSRWVVAGSVFAAWQRAAWRWGER